MSLVFTQLAADSFQRANENPLSQGGNWTATNIEILNDECVCSIGPAGEAFYTGIAWPSNQYVQVEIASWTATGDTELVVNLGWVGEVIPPFDATAGYQFVVSVASPGATNFRLEDIAAGNLTILDQTVETVIEVGDVFLAAALDTTLTLFRNGQVVFVATGSQPIPTSGVPGFFLNSFDSHAPAVINFAGGRVTATPPGRFTFHEHPNSTSSAVLYDVVDSGDSKTVGHVFWDNIVARGWSFNLRDNQPFIAAGSSDTADIQAFAAALPSPNIITVYDSTVPASTRFNFTPVQRRPGQPVLQYLVSDGPSIAYGSIGQIIWDGVFDRWAFLQTNASTEITAAADVNCIVNFSADLSLISPNQVQL